MALSPGTGLRLLCHRLMNTEGTDAYRDLPEIVAQEKSPVGDHVPSCLKLLHFLKKSALSYVRTCLRGLSMC